MAAIKEVRQTLYKTIYNNIIDEINNGNYISGDRLPTECELIEKYSVSRITAIRALQELVQDGYAVRFPGKGSFVLDVNKNHASPEQQASYNNTIALIMPFSSDIIPPLLFAMQNAAEKRNLMISIFNSQKDVIKEKLILEQISNMNFAGIICHPIESYDNISSYSKLLFNKTPLITIDKVLPYLDVPCVTTDNFSCAYNIVTYLIEHGHKNIAYYCHTLNDGNESLRFKGYLKALIDNAITPNNNYFMEVEKLANAQNMLGENNPDIQTKINHQLLKLMSLKQKPTAIFCAFDLLAAYVEQQASALNISIPSDLSIVGFDNLPLCNHLQIPLTSVAQNFEAIGNSAIDTLLKVKNGENCEKITMLGGSIIERKTVLDLNLKIQSENTITNCN